MVVRWREVERLRGRGANFMPYALYKNILILIECGPLLASIFWDEGGLLLRDI